MAELLAILEVIRTRRPREVVHIVLHESMRHRVIAVRLFVLRRAGGTDFPSGWNGDADVVSAVVGKELAVGVELVRCPRCVTKDRQLGKPLRDEIKVADCARARKRAWHAGDPFDAEGDSAARWD